MQLCAGVLSVRLLFCFPVTCVCWHSFKSILWRIFLQTLPHNMKLPFCVPVTHLYLLVNHVYATTCTSVAACKTLFKLHFNETPHLFKALPFNCLLCACSFRSNRLASHVGCNTLSPWFAYKVRSISDGSFYDSYKSPSSKTRRSMQWSRRFIVRVRRWNFDYIKKL